MDDYTKDIFGQVLHRQVACALRKLHNISNLRQLAELMRLRSNVDTLKKKELEKSYMQM